MPTITRWFRVTHDINSDPEIWELRELHGDRAALVWLEMLSIADRNSGVVGPDSDQTRNQLASKCRTNRTKVGLILGWCRIKGWLVSGANPTATRPEPDVNPAGTRSAPDSYLRIAKWRKYNKVRDVDEPLSDSETTPTPNPTPNPNQKNKILAENHKKTVAHPAPVKAWSVEDQWLKELISRQWFLSATNGQLDDYAWWEDVAAAINGIERKFIEPEFAKMSAWLKENPSRKPTAKGMRRFIRSWLERAKNQQRRIYVAK